MKLYTRTGDEGRTSLFGGQRVDKDALRVDAYGTVDELNSVLGLAASGCIRREGEQRVPVQGLAATHGQLTQIQSRLFEIGADLATPTTDPPLDDADRFVPRIEQRQIDELERWIDTTCEQLPEMKSFILPGGTELAARLHVARTVCRRAERLVVALQKVETVSEEVVRYLNRLSDLLFAMARLANHAADVEDVPWVNPKR